MLGAAILCVSLSAVGAGDYLRPFGSKVFDQAKLDAETFGDKKSLTRDEDGLRVTLPPGGPEAGWKTPQMLRIGGDCTIVATAVIRKLPKPTGEDGVAIGLAVATQMLDQPDATLLRQVEPDGKEIFRSVEKQMMGMGGGMQQPVMNRRGMVMPMPFGFNAPGGKPPKPVRFVVPAKGTSIRLEIRRQGSTVRYQVFDEVAKEPREISHFELPPMDLIGVKLFASNRSGVEPVEVLFKDLSIRADRISGLGTAVRTIFGTVLHGDPTIIEGKTLVIGGPPPAPPAPKPAAAAPPTSTPPVVTPAPVVAPPPPTLAVAPAAAAPAPVVVVMQPGVAMVVAAPAPAAVAAPAAVVTETVTKAARAPAAQRVVQPQGAVAGNPNQPPQAPRSRVALDEVETIGFERMAMLSARFFGQPNVDTTMPGGDDALKDVKDKPKDDKDQAKDKPKEGEAKKPAEPPAGDDLAAPAPGTVAPPKIVKVDAKPNGIRDLHLGLNSLREAAIRQITVTCPTDKGQAIWQLDTTGTKNWPLTISRSGLDTWADLFLEPPAGDCHDKQFNVNLMYMDNQQANTFTKATEHTDPNLKFDPDSPAPALNARVYLAGDEQMFGKLEAITEQALILTTAWGDRVDLPMTRILGVYMGMADHKETPEAFAKRLRNRGDKDLLLARAKDGEVVGIAGVVEAAKGNKLSFSYQDKTRTLPLKGVEGFILASRPAPEAPTEVRPKFSLAGGVVVSGRWAKIEATEWQVETPWGQTLKLPANEVQSIRFLGGQMTYLSDLEPTQVEEIPYFGRRTPYRRDVSLSGAKLKLDGQAIDKGLAVHSRTVLTYDLNRRFNTFEALVGFDEAGMSKGRVDCRVFADGKEIYANPDLRADAPPVSLSLAVTNAEQLKLMVDFGENEDIGDRLIWGNARLYSRSPALGLTVIPAPASETVPPPNPVTPGATSPPAAGTPTPAAGTPAPAAAPPVATTTIEFAPTPLIAPAVPAPLPPPENRS